MKYGGAYDQCTGKRALVLWLHLCYLSIKNTDPALLMEADTITAKSNMPAGKPETYL